MTSFMPSLFAAIGVLSIALASPDAVQRIECSKAADFYERIVDDITDALSSYENCLAESRGRDTCSNQLWEINAAHEDFKAAVSDYAHSCRGTEPR